MHEMNGAGGVLKRIFGSSDNDSQPPKKLKVNDSPEEPLWLRHSLCRKLNESLYELHKPDGTVKMQVLFVHGLQLRNQSYSQTNYQSNSLYLSTWLSEDEHCVWPKAWLSTSFPDAQIFCLCYDGNIPKTGALFDMTKLGENLLADLIGEGHIGQIPFCPVVLVGHSFGGLLIKQLCHQAFYPLRSPQEQAAYNRFLTNVRGIFYYATPHDGMQYADKLRNELQIDDNRLSYLSTHSKETKTLNEDFDEICRVYSFWLLCGVGETLPTKLDKEHLLVTEASARLHSHDFNLIPGVDHFSICRPANEGSRSFTELKRLLYQISATTEKEKEYGPMTQVGQIFASTIELGRGSNGTVVYKGYFREKESRGVTVPHIPIAVKQLRFSHHKNAEDEIRILLKCTHENVVRYQGKEETDFFIYLAFERYSFSLDDLIRYQRPPMRLGVNNPTQTEPKLPSDGKDVEIPTQTEPKLLSDGKDVEIPTQKELQLRSEEDWKLWCQWHNKWRPTPKLMKLMENLIAGLKHLHEKNIAHRDLKPHNVLIKRGNGLQAKIANIGLSKELGEAEVPLDKLTGSHGWQAPEKLIKERRCELEGKGYQAADIFSLGCLLYYCITGGEHPYGSEDEPLERETNIANRKKVNMKEEHESMSPEATDLVERLLDDVPGNRLRSQDILDHPFFWDAKKRLEFLQRASDKLKADDILGKFHIVADVDSRVNCGSWTSRVKAKLQVGYDGKKYKYQNTVCGLLRLIRNLKHHFHDNPNFQTILKSDPDGIDEYFTVRFPRLLSEVYHVIGSHYKTDTSFQEYYPKS